MMKSRKKCHKNFENLLINKHFMAKNKLDRAFFIVKMLVGREKMIL